MSKLCVMNLSGNCGKSTICKHVLLPLEPEATLIIIETFNSTESEGSGMKIDGKQVDHIQEEILISEHVIVDVGSSNIEKFYQGLQLYAGSINDFDKFIIPVTPDGKIKDDSLTTIILLIEQLNVPKEKIRIIFNKINNDDIATDFKMFLLACDDLGISYDLESYIPESDFFEGIRGTENTIKSILEDETDYRAKIKDAKTRESKQKYAKMIILPRLALGLKNRLSKIGNYING